MAYRRPYTERWQTICSDLKELYFFSLVDMGELVLTVNDSTHKYEFRFERHTIGPYMVVEESLRESDEKVITPIGWTAIVEDPDFIKLFNPAGIVVNFSNKPLTHYSIGTYDCFLEILATKEPTITKYPKD